MELYLFGGIAAVIAILWLRVGYLKKKRKQAEVKAAVAERTVKHDKAVHHVERQRREEQPARIKEAVQNAEDDEFSDFYDDTP